MQKNVPSSLHVWEAGDVYMSTVDKQWPSAHGHNKL